MASAGVNRADSGGFTGCGSDGGRPGRRAELDGFERGDRRAYCFGRRPVPTLVAPRAIACALAVPLLTVIIDASALLGSLAAELTVGRSTNTLFWNKTLVFLRLADVVPQRSKRRFLGWWWR